MTILVDENGYPMQDNWSDFSWDNLTYHTKKLKRVIYIVVSEDEQTHRDKMANHHFTMLMIRLKVRIL